MRKAAQGVFAESIYSGKKRLFHGSEADIKVGDIIRPGESPGAAYIGLPGKSAAFATGHIPDAGSYAGKGGKIYEVAPISRDLAFLPNPHGGIHVASPTGFKVIAVHNPDYQIPARGGNKAARYAQKEASTKRKERKAKLKMENDPAFADAIARLERIMK